MNIEENGIKEFLDNLNRSRAKYPKNGCMYDGLIGEIDELRRAYFGDGDIQSEALDVAVVAFRIATEGDSGGNELLPDPIGDADFVAVPRGLIGAICYAITNNRDANKLVNELRRYTTGELSRGINISDSQTKSQP